MGLEWGLERACKVNGACTSLDGRRRGWRGGGGGRERDETVSVGTERMGWRCLEIGETATCVGRGNGYGRLRLRGTASPAVARLWGEVGVRVVS